jgi:hypothetical protein
VFVEIAGERVLAESNFRFEKLAKVAIKSFPELTLPKSKDGATELTLDMSATLIILPTGNPEGSAVGTPACDEDEERPSRFLSGAARRRRAQKMIQRHQKTSADRLRISRGRQNMFSKAPQICPQSSVGMAGVQRSRRNS